MFRGYSDVDVKVVLDRQPLLGTGPLPNWLRNIAHGRSMLALDTYQNNLCLWRCIAVHRGARPDRSTTAARELAKSFFELRATPNDCPKTSLDELDRVERHLNQKLDFSDWLGIRAYEPVRVEGEVVWHLKRNPPAKLTNILTIGIYEGHAFVIKDISKLARTYACVHCRTRFTQACNLQRHTQTCAQGKTVIDSRPKESKHRRQLSRRPFIQNIQLLQNLFAGSNKKRRGGKFIFTTRHAGTAASDGLSALLSTDMTPKRGLYFNTTAVTGTDAENVTRTIVIKSLPTMTKQEKTGLKQL